MVMNGDSVPDEARPALLSHRRAGAGEPLVLIHGIGSRWQVWQPILPALESQYEVIAVDLPGFGGSPPGPVDVPSFASAVAEFVGLPSFHVAGNSLGGGVALELGRRGIARSVTAFAPIGFWGPVSRRWCQAAVTSARSLGRATRSALPTLASGVPGRIALFSAFFAHPARLDAATCVADVDALIAAPGFRATCDAFADWRFGPVGALADIPVTVAWGSRDAILLPSQARRAAAALPSARHVRLRSCGHLPFSDDPAACVRLIDETMIIDKSPIGG